METITAGDRSYVVDEHGFLLGSDQWDEGFSALMAPRVNLPEGLSEKHWAVIRFIRDYFHETGHCPLVYATCRANGLTWHGLRELFPTGYLRGACLLAGVTYEDRCVNYYGEAGQLHPAPERETKPATKTYHVDIHGFLVDPSHWDEEYAIAKAEEMKLPEGLTDEHWRILRFLRESYRTRGVVPTVYECCESNGIALDELARLFPDGYHRGAVKIAGLRVLFRGGWSASCIIA